jgi:hypothetical protein
MGDSAPMPDLPLRFVPALRRGAALRHRLQGLHPALPAPLDHCAERWAGTPPRIRLAAGLLAVVALIGVTESRVRSAERRWGGAPATVWVASADLGAGEPLGGLERRQVPPTVAPPAAVTSPPRRAVLSVPLPAGTILTEAHLAARGPAAGLAPGLRAVPIPVEHGWGVVAGGWVDVWVLGAGREDDTRKAAARSRPVLEVHEEGITPTALVGLDLTEVEAVTGALADRRLLLTHAPPPDDG